MKIVNVKLYFLSFIKTGLILCLIFTAFFCAGQIPPSGGPPDKTPPVILETYPKSGELNFNDNHLSFSFNKYLNRRSLEESFFISPPVGDLSFEWDGKEVTVNFSDSLRKNTTYIATLGTDLSDTKGNKLTNSYPLPFSTDDKLDSASLSGIVYDEKPEGVTIFGYLLNDNDSLNPSINKPDYVTQSGKNGSFELPYLQYGTYRIFAIRDEYKNLLYDIGIDQAGVLNSDVTLSESVAHIKGLQFMMSIEDTAPPFLSSAKSIDDSHILLRLSEPIDWKSVKAERIQIEDTISHSLVSVAAFGFVDEFNKEAQIVSGKQDIGRAFKITLDGWKDLAGNLMTAPMNKSEFVSTIFIDTTKPEIDLKDLKNRSGNFPIDDSIKISFNEPVMREIFERNFKIEDSLHKNLAGKFEWQHGTKTIFIPDSFLLPGMNYSLSIIIDSIIDYSGNSQKDSTLNLIFKTVDEKFLSEMKGVFSDKFEDDSGIIYLTAYNLSKKELKPKVTTIKKFGPFLFENLLEGKYIIKGFCDTDGSGSYTYGKIFPFKRAERFVNYNDTLKVRARWPLEGIQIQIK
ncbi:MAG: Ig-like domain-containing protein [Ignavibacteriales bacterium]|nr:Ig-like domain-containing protein [Ignavibacteriales bacterium]